MPETTILSISLPPEIARQVEELARKENRTTGELFSDAFSRYQRDREWEQILSYGAARAEEAGLRSEEDVVRLVQDWRRTHSPDNPARS